MTERLKILISAYACSPYKGSEPGVGWGFIAALAVHHDLWVIVEEEKFRADIERYLAEHPAFGERVHFHFIHKQRNRALRKLWPPSYYRYYRRWQRDALTLAKKLHVEIGFDLAHQLTMVGFREPGYLWQLGIPFVWGPVGGMGLFPWRFMHKIGTYGALYYLGYNLYNLVQMRLLSRPRLAAQAAGVGLLAATSENRKSIQDYWGYPSTVLPEVGLPGAPIHHTLARRPDEPLRIVWSGQHTPGKALNLGLEALARLPADAAWQLDIIGTGPRTGAWAGLTTRLGISQNCRFHGWLKRDEALAVMKSAHVMLITSLRDLTSTVTIEALSLGLPIVCLDHCGFADVVNEQCGIKVPITTPGKAVDGLTTAIARLAKDENFRHALAEGAIRRAQDYSWEEKAKAVDDIYRKRLAQPGSAFR